MLCILSNFVAMLRKCDVIMGITVALLAFSCQSPQQDSVPVVGFVEAFEDATIAQARQGFADALRDNGYSESDGTIEIIYRNAQGDAATLNQIVSYFNTQKVDLIGTSTTLSTLSVIQRVKNIPIFMTVTAMPEILGLLDADGNPPKNLFGAGEDLNYIDTSFTIITGMIKPTGRKLKVGMIYNQAEPQSVEAYQRIAQLAGDLGVDLVAQPLHSSAEAQLVVRSLLSKNIDTFFANPDNTVFAAFETIVKNCDEKGVPVFTSESGLVARGAVAAFGADIYQWGYQSGAQAAAYLKTGSTDGLQVEKLEVRKRVYNPMAAQRFGFVFPGEFERME